MSCSRLCGSSLPEELPRPCQPPSGAPKKWPCVPAPSNAPHSTLHAFVPNLAAIQSFHVASMSSPAVGTLHAQAQLVSELPAGRSRRLGTVVSFVPPSFELATFAGILGPPSGRKQAGALRIDAQGDVI